MTANVKKKTILDEKFLNLVSFSFFFNVLLT